MELEGRRVLITGATRGIGAALATAFAGAGARVALVARTEGPLREMAARLGGTAHQADLGDPAEVAGLIERVEREGGAVDVLVNNAGAAVSERIDAMSAEQTESVFRLNLLTPVELCRQAVPRMLAREGGHIVNISSIAGCGTFPGLSVYSSSKAGLSHFTAGLRADLRGLPVDTTLVEIGPVSTELFDDARRYVPTARAFQRAFRLGAFVELSPEQVASAVVAGVRSGQQHVRLPQRIALMPALVEVPRRLVELMLTGLPHHV